MLEIDIPVLIVMKSSPLIADLREYLIDLGVEPSLVLHVETLEASLEHLRTSPETIVLFDIMLPNAQEDILSRYSAVAPRSCRVAVLLAEDAHQSTRALLNAGADGVIAETALTVPTLESTLEHAWHGRNLRLELHQLRHEVDHARTQLRVLSTTDPQTGLCHGRYFEERLAEDWKRAAPMRGVISMIGIAIDGYDAWTARTPTPVIDEYLQTLARRLQSSIRRAGDLPARLGRDRFVVLLPRADTVVMDNVIRRLSQNIARDRLLAPPGSEWPSATLAGLTEIADNNTIPTDMLAKLANVLISGQRAGGNRIVSIETTP